MWKKHSSRQDKVLPFILDITPSPEKLWGAAQTPNDPNQTSQQFMQVHLTHAVKSNLAQS